MYTYSKSSIKFFNSFLGGLFLSLLLPSFYIIDFLKRFSASWLPLALILRIIIDEPFEFLEPPSIYGGNIWNRSFVFQLQAFPLPLESVPLQNFSNPKFFLSQLLKPA